MVLRREVRVRAGRDPEPSLVILDAQQARTGRQGPSFHDVGGLGRGRVQRGAKRSLLVDSLGLPVAVRVTSSRPHDSTAGRELLDEVLPVLPRVEVVVADRGYRGLAHHVASRHGCCFEVRHWESRPDGFKPIAQMWRVEDWVVGGVWPVRSRVRRRRRRHGVRWRPSGCCSAGCAPSRDPGSAAFQRAHLCAFQIEIQVNLGRPLSIGSPSRPTRRPTGELTTHGYLGRKRPSGK